MKKEIFGIKSPEKECTDKNCPFHGQINVKKEFIKGTIIKRDIHGSATIVWERSYFIPKYERYATRKAKLRAHNPHCIDAQIGQKVLAVRSRPLSKMKNHIILQVIEEELKKEAPKKTNKGAQPKAILK